MHSNVALSGRSWSDHGDGPRWRNAGEAECGTEASPCVESEQMWLRWCVGGTSEFYGGERARWSELVPVMATAALPELLRAVRKGEGGGKKRNESTGREWASAGRDVVRCGSTWPG